MKYVLRETLPYSPRCVWSVLEDVEHFARNDPFHHEFKYLGGQRSGIGTVFTMKHTYLPIFPFGADQVICTVTQWEPGRIQTLLESNPRPHRSHVQRFRLIPQTAGTAVEYSITYKGVPSWIFPLAQWVRWTVSRRMKDKLRELAQQCGQKEERPAVPDEFLRLKRTVRRR